MNTMLITAGGLRIDYLITQSDEARLGLVGGNALYAAVGAALWGRPVHLWARIGDNYPREALTPLPNHLIYPEGLVPVRGAQDHRTFFAYTPDGRRDDTNPAAHFQRIGQPLPAALHGYRHSTPQQDDPHNFEPLALRPADWPASFAGVTAVHLSPLSLATHRTLPPFLRAQGVRQITLDPGERYMVPRCLPYLQALLPHIDVFLPSAMEIRSLFGPQADLADTAVTLHEWGANQIVIKDGANGVWLYPGDDGRVTRFPPYHSPGDKRVIDVTGAGDSFCGGFIAGLAQTGDLSLAIRQGLISASLVIEGYGALYAMTRQPEVQTRLAALV